jgi:hypothetical protein
MLTHRSSTTLDSHAGEASSLTFGKLLLLIVLLGITILLCAYATTAAEGGHEKTLVSVAATDPKLTPLVRNILQHEIRAEADDKSLWCYRKFVEKDGKHQLFSACQSQGAEIDRLMAENGKPLSQRQSQIENQRIQKLLGNEEQLKKQKEQQADDARQATKLLKMIPEAFLFQQVSNDGDRATLRFIPNPQFQSSGYSELVFHHMEGTLTLDLKQKRLVEINGRLNSEVKFAGGLLGHLDKGGTFLVKQQEVGPGCWEMTRMDVQMNGRALFFKTIGVRTNEIDTDFHAVPPKASIQQVAALTVQVHEKDDTRTQR